MAAAKFRRSLRARRQFDTAERGGPRGDPAPRDLAGSKRSVSSTAAADQRRIGTQLRPLVAPRQEAAQRVADQCGDGLVAGEREPVDDRLDLAELIRCVRRVGIGVVRVEQFRAEVVGGRHPLGGDEARQ